MPFRQILVLERWKTLRAGDFVLRTTSLRGWTAAILTVLHDSFSETANSFAEVQVILTCRGVGGRGALLLFAFAAAFPTLTDEL